MVYLVTAWEGISALRLTPSQKTTHDKITLNTELKVSRTILCFSKINLLKPKNHMLCAENIRYTHWPHFSRKFSLSISEVRLEIILVSDEHKKNKGKIISKYVYSAPIQSD